MSTTSTPPRQEIPLAGIGYATALVMCWATYNVAAKAAIDGAFRSQDISTLRFTIAGLVFIPLAATRYMSYWRQLGLWRVLALAFLSGPIFGLMGVGGFTFAPLSHGMLFAPSAAMIVGTLLSRFYGGAQLTLQRVIGMALMIIGLAILVGFELGDAGPQLLLGEAMFLIAGTMWGGFTFLLGRWNLDGTATTVVIGATSAVFAVPIYFATWGGSLPDVTLHQVAFQAFMQGVLGGVVAVFAMVKATEKLGAAQTALLPTLTPAAAMTVSAIFVGITPGTGEIAGAAIVMLGLGVAIKS